MKRLLLTGGGTGGHLYPALALAQAFAAGGTERELLFVGSAKGLEARVVPAAGIPFHGLPARGWRGKGLGQRFLFLLDLGRAFFIALGILRRFDPDALIATGSYVSLPMLLAARITGRPYFLQEQNSMPGKVPRLAAAGARGLFLAYENASRWLSKRPPHHLTGNPLRAEFLERAARRRETRPPDPRRLLIFGGSRGARRLNDAAVEALPRLAERFEFEAVVQTGEEDHRRVEAALAAMAPAVRVLPYLENMPEVMERSHWVVCRSGAMTLAELTAMGLPAVLVPYPHAVDDHQRRNAEELLTAGAARVIDDAALDGDRLHEILTELWSEPATELAMARASAALARPEATERILALVEKSLAGPRGR